MIQFLLIVLTITAVLMVAFLIPFLIETRRTVITLRKAVEEKLNPALDELQINLRSMRNVSDNISEISSDLRKFSRSVSEIGDTVHSVKGVVDAIGSSASVEVLSLKSGVRAALEYLLINSLRKGEKK